ncbi:MAG: hypothetical protein HY924_08120 [Elusimicrobia bacterium]|nr:hypothetical protein [Elusimicrobiota bacterium]
MRKVSAAFVLILAVAWAWGGPAPQAEASKPACQLDMQRFCAPETKRGDRRAINACMDKHIAALSKECRRYRLSRTTAMEKLKQACAVESVSSCQGEEALPLCLGKHEAELSEECAAALDLFRKTMRKESKKASIVLPAAAKPPAKKPSQAPAAKTDPPASAPR